MLKERMDSLDILSSRVSNIFSSSMQVTQKVKAGRIQVKESKVPKIISITRTAKYASECGYHGGKIEIMPP